MELDVQLYLAAARLGDAQRNVRATALVLDLVRSAGAGATGAVSWPHTMGAYRFYNNAAVPLDGLYAPARAALADLIPAGARAYVVHDTSVVDDSGHATKADRRRVGNAHGRGYELVAALVLDAQGRPRGPVAQALRTATGVWSSEAPDRQPDADHAATYVAHAAAAARHLPGRDLVHVLDREGDDVWLQRALAGDGAHYVIRASYLARRVVDAAGLEVPLAAAVAAVALAPHAWVDRPGGGGGQLWIGETRVTLHGKSWRGHKRGAAPQPGAPRAVRVVVAELRRDGGVDRWVLLTTLADALADVVQVYVWRWRVERLFWFVKVGFRLEAWTQQTGDAIARRLALASLAAMVLYQLQHAAADAATAPAAAAVLREAAAWGGHAGAPDAPVGPLVLLRGLTLLIHANALLEQYGAAGLQQRLAHLQSVVRLDFTPPQFPGAKRYPHGKPKGV